MGGGGGGVGGWVGGSVVCVLGRGGKKGGGGGEEGAETVLSKRVDAKKARKARQRSIMKNCCSNCHCCDSA